MVPNDIGNTYLLVHGGFHGGWCWVGVSDRLRRLDHRVHTPTLTGVGERTHLLNADVGLETHISDILSVIDAEELDDIILVAHSLGGLPATAVADRTPDRIRQVIFLDAMLVEDGVSYADTTADFSYRSVGRREDGCSVANVYPASVFGLTDEADINWVERHLTPHPYKAFTDPLHLDNPIGNSLPCTYIECTRPLFPAAEYAHALAEQQTEWNLYKLSLCHDAMVSSPGIVSEVLQNLASTGSITPLEDESVLEQ